MMMDVWNILGPVECTLDCLSGFHNYKDSAYFCEEIRKISWRRLFWLELDDAHFEEQLPLCYLSSRRPLLSLNFSIQSLLHWRDGRELNSPAATVLSTQLRLCTVAASAPRPSNLDHFPQSQRRPPRTPRPAQDPAEDHKWRWDSAEAVHFQGDHTEVGGRQLHLVRGL